MEQAFIPEELLRAADHLAGVHLPRAGLSTLGTPAVAQNLTVRRDVFEDFATWLQTGKIDLSVELQKLHGDVRSDRSPEIDDRVKDLVAFAKKYKIKALENYVMTTFWSETFVLIDELVETWDDQARDESLED